MDWVQPILTLLLLVHAALIQAQAHPCYIAQEPIIGNGYRWYIAERNPCECTKFQMGGLNTKPQPRPSGVDGIYYVPLTTNKEKIGEVLGCEDASAAMHDSPCDSFTTRRSVIEKASKVVLPIEMELTIDAPESNNESESATLYFAKGRPTTENAKYARFTLDLGTGLSSISFAPHGILQPKENTSDWNFLGSDAVMITFDGMRIEVGLKGIPESFIEYDSMIPSLGSVWSIGFYSNSDDTVWSFYKPCGLFKD